MTETTSQVDRSLSQVISIGWIVMVFGMSLSADNLDDFASWWKWGVLVIVALVFVNATLGTVLPMWVLRAIWVAIPLGSILGLALLLKAYQGPAPEELVAWQMNAAAMFLCYLVFWMPVAAVFATVAVAMFLPSISSLFVLGPTPTATILYAPILLTHIGIVVFFIGVRHALIQADTAAIEARKVHALQLRAVAEAKEHGRFSAVIHDEVLSSLSAALRFDGKAPATLRDSANTALAALRLLEDREPTDVSVGQTSAGIVLGRLEKHSREIVPGTEIRISQVDGVISTVVADAAIGAVAEALRNVRKHAGEGALCVLSGRLSPSGIRIEVRDDGVGFSPAEIAHDRMGLSHSLIARMRAVGGEASIKSHLDGGTTVVLQWTP